MKEKHKYIILIGIIAIFVIGIVFINNKEIFQNEEEVDVQETIEEDVYVNPVTTDKNISKQETSKSNASKDNNTSTEHNSSSTNNITPNSSKTDSVKYTCISGYTLDDEKKECYKYYTLESSKTKTCPEGYSLYITDDLQEKCRKYVINDDVMIYSNPYCVDSGNIHQELSVEDNACLDPNYRINKTQEECNASGYFWSNSKNYCYIKKANIMYQKSCPNGYKMSESVHCYKYDIIDRKVISATCPDGYILSDDQTTCTYKSVVSATKQY